MMKTILSIVAVVLSVASAQAQQLVATAPITSAGTLAPAASLILKAGKGSLFTLEAVAPTTVANLLFLDSATLPGNGAVSPIKCWPVTAGQLFSVAYTISAVQFLNGLVAAFSTNSSCYTLALASTVGNPFISGEVK